MIKYIHKVLVTDCDPDVLEKELDFAVAEGYRFVGSTAYKIILIKEIPENTTTDEWLKFDKIEH